MAANAYNPGFCPIVLNLLRSSGKISTPIKMDFGLLSIHMA